MNAHVNIDNLFLTVKQVAERYNVSTDTIWRWKREGKIPAAVSIGDNTTRWRLSDLIEHESTLQACFSMDASWLLSD